MHGPPQTQRRLLLVVEEAIPVVGTVRAHPRLRRPMADGFAEDNPMWSAGS
jgi:hypothetical protein